MPGQAHVGVELPHQIGTHAGLGSLQFIVGNSLFDEPVEFRIDPLLNGFRGNVLCRNANKRKETGILASGETGNRLHLQGIAGIYQGFVQTTGASLSEHILQHAVDGVIVAEHAITVIAYKHEGLRLLYERYAAFAGLLGFFGKHRERFFACRKPREVLLGQFARLLRVDIARHGNGKIVGLVVLIKERFSLGNGERLHIRHMPDDRIAVRMRLKCG